MMWSHWSHRMHNVFPVCSHIQLSDFGKTQPLLFSTQEDQQVVIEPLIVGVLLFIPCLALLPTTLVWFLAVTLLAAFPAVAQGALVAASRVLRVNPPLLLIWRMVLPGMFPSGEPPRKA